MDGGAWQAAVHGIAKSQTQLSGFTFTFHFCALEKEMATHSSVLAWRIPGTGEPGGLPSMELQSWTRPKRLSSSSSSILLCMYIYNFFIHSSVCRHLPRQTNAKTCQDRYVLANGHVRQWEFFETCLLETEQWFRNNLLFSCSTHILLFLIKNFLLRFRNLKFIKIFLWAWEMMKIQ